MPVQISCPHCGKQYQLKESILGKQVKCTQCAGQFVAGQAAAATASTATGVVQEQLTHQQLNQFGIEGNIEKQADVFAAAPTPGPQLGNFAGEDPGFDAGDVFIPTPSNSEDNANPYAAVLNNPALKAKKKDKGKAAQAKKLAQAEKIREEHVAQEWEIQVWGNLFITFAVLTFFLTLPLFIQLMQLEAYTIGGVGFGTVFVIAAFQLIAGIGLRNLSNWGRIMATIWLIPALAGFGVGTLIAIFLLIMFWNTKGNMIFSGKYKKVIKMTPHVQYESMLTYLLVGIFVILPMIVAALFVLIGGTAAMFMVPEAN